MLTAQSKLQFQRGGTVLGFILGLLVGLLVSLGLAVYVTKVPIPFLNKSVSRTAEQDAAEEKKNKDWDPNAPLYNKSSKTGASPTAPVAGSAPSTQPPKTEDKPEPIADKTTPSTNISSSTSATDLIGDFIRSKTDTSGSNPSSATLAQNAPNTGTGATPADPFYYYVQVGAFRSNDEAESQRAKLALQGYDIHISEKEQAGKTVFRVRIGPMNSKDDAEKVQVKLATQKTEAAIVRVQR
jgi:cell division protein FtsN